MKRFMVLVLTVLSVSVLSISAIAQQKPSVASSLATGDTLAGWSKATWGMSEDEVLSAFAGEAKRLEKVDTYGNTHSYTSVGIDNYTIGRVECKVRFLFDDTSRKLSRVIIASKTKESLGIAKSEFETLEGMLIEKYGPQTYGKKDNHIDAPSSWSSTWSFKTTKIGLGLTKYMDIYLTLVYEPVALTKKEADKL